MHPKDFWFVVQSSLLKSAANLKPELKFVQKIPFLDAMFKAFYRVFAKNSISWCDVRSLLSSILQSYKTKSCQPLVSIQSWDKVVINSQKFLPSFRSFFVPCFVYFSSSCSVLVFVFNVWFPFIFFFLAVHNSSIGDLVTDWLTD